MTELDFDELHSLVNASLTVRNTPQEVISDIGTYLKGAMRKGIFEIDEEFEYYYFIDDDDAEELMNQEIAGKTFSERIEEHWSDANPEAIQRVAETEFNRMYNIGREEAVKSYASSTGKSIYKTWNTMLDDRVRTTHSYLESETVPLGEKFYTYDGDSAFYPCGFENASNNINCRCSLTYTVR